MAAITYESIKNKIKLRHSEHSYSQYSFTEENDDKELLVFSFEDIDNTWSLNIKVIDKEGYFLEDTYKRCLYNPQIKPTPKLEAYFDIRRKTGSVFYDTLNEIEEKDSDWMLETTEENKEKLIVEIYKRFYDMK